MLVRLWGEEDEEYEKERAQKRMGGEEIFLALVAFALLLRMRVALPLSVAMMRPKPSPFGVTVISFDISP